MWIMTVVFKNGDENHKLKYCQKIFLLRMKTTIVRVNISFGLNAVLAVYKNTTEKTREAEMRVAATLRAINMEHTTDKCKLSQEGYFNVTVVCGMHFQSGYSAISILSSFSLIATWYTGSPNRLIDPEDVDWVPLSLAGIGNSKTLDRNQTKKFCWRGSVQGLKCSNWKTALRGSLGPNWFVFQWHYGLQSLPKHQIREL